MQTESTPEPTTRAIASKLDCIIGLLEQLVQAHSQEIAEYQQRHGSRSLNAFEVRRLACRGDAEEKSTVTSEIVNQVRAEIRAALSTDPTNPSAQPQK